jgi:hypothetical protein
MGRFALGKVPLPDEDFEVRDRMTKTIPGVGDCPQRDGCMLEVHRLLEEMRRELSGELRELRVGVNALLQAKGIRNMDSTPAGKRGALDISAGPVKLHGKAFTVAVVALLLAALLGTIGAGAYVLGEWGRPAQASTK